MAKNTQYQCFREQAKEDRAVADERFKTATVMTLSDEEVQKIAEDMHYSEVLSAQFNGKISEEHDTHVYRVGHFGNNMMDDYSQYATLGDKNASPEDRKKALDSLTKEKEYWKDYIPNNNSSSLKVELKNVSKEKYETFEAEEKSTDGESDTQSDNENKNKGTADALAFYSPTKGTITLNVLTDEAREKLRAELKEEVENGSYGAVWRLKRDSETLYMLNDTMAVLSTGYHENNHKNDFDNSGGMELRRVPKSAAKADRLTETKSCAVEYLAMAHQYTEMKKKGVETVEVNGEKKRLDYMLKFHAGLQDVVDKYGFDVNDPQSVRRVVEASSRYWHEDRVEGYNEQAGNALNLGLAYLNSKPMSEQLKLLKDEDEKYQKVSEQMLKNTYIGQNTVVDLRHCRDLLDTMTDNDARKVGNGAYVVSYEELKSVSDYLEKKGIKKDSDKMGYLAKHIKDIGYRKEDKDPELTQLLLAQGNTVLCADGLEYSKNQEGAVVFHKDGKEYAMVPVIKDNTPQQSHTLATLQATK